MLHLRWSALGTACPLCTSCREGGGHAGIECHMKIVSGRKGRVKETMEFRVRGHSSVDFSMSSSSQELFFLIVSGLVILPCLI